MYDNILVPTDGSDLAEVAAAHAISLAELHDATVHVLHCVEPIPLGRIPAGTTAAGSEHGDVIDEMEAQGRRAIDEVAADAETEGVTAVEHLTFGYPSSEIIEYVEDNDIDLIVMGTKGRSAAERFVMGSVADKVVRRSPVPVLTIRPSPA